MQAARQTHAACPGCLPLVLSGGPGPYYTHTGAEGAGAPAYQGSETRSASCLWRFGRAVSITLAFATLRSASCLFRDAPASRSFGKALNCKVRKSTGTRRAGSKSPKSPLVSLSAKVFCSLGVQSRSSHRA